MELRGIFVFFVIDTGGFRIWIKGIFDLVEFPSRAMVIGGAASGKSAFAEAFVIAQGKPRVYLATAQAFDDEMASKISEHKAARAADGWTTLEEPLEVAERLLHMPPGETVLLDCATMWLSNQMNSSDDIRPKIDALCAAMLDSPAHITVVTNEVGQGIVPDNALARRFRNLQGNLNYSLAKNCDLVVQVVAGLPNVLKGSLPQW